VSLFRPVLPRSAALLWSRLVCHLAGSVFAVGTDSAVLRPGWLLPQFAAEFLAQGSARQMPF
jgi:hypothetical protein